MSKIYQTRTPWHLCSATAYCANGSTCSYQYLSTVISSANLGRTYTIFQTHYNLVSARLHSLALPCEKSLGLNLLRVSSMRTVARMSVVPSASKTRSRWMSPSSPSNLAPELCRRATWAKTSMHLTRACVTRCRDADYTRSPLGAACPVRCRDAACTRCSSASTRCTCTSQSHLPASESAEAREERRRQARVCSIAHINPQLKTCARNYREQEK